MHREVWRSSEDSRVQTVIDNFVPFLSPSPSPFSFSFLFLSPSFFSFLSLFSTHIRHRHFPHIKLQVTVKGSGHFSPSLSHLSPSLSLTISHSFVPFICRSLSSSSFCYSFTSSVFFLDDTEPNHEYRIRLPTS